MVDWRWLWVRDIGNVVLLVRVKAVRGEYASEWCVFQGPNPLVVSIVGRGLVRPSTKSAVVETGATQCNAQAVAVVIGATRLVSEERIA